MVRPTEAAQTDARSARLQALSQLAVEGATEEVLRKPNYEALTGSADEAIADSEPAATRRAQVLIRANA